MSHDSCWKHRGGLMLAAAGGLLMMLARPVPSEAQTSAGSINTGAISFTAGLDIPSAYLFRGILQEEAPRLTLWPRGDVGIRLRSNGAAVTFIDVNVGLWESLQTGSSGTDGPTRHAHFEEDFYTTLTFGLRGDLRLAMAYVARTSPNQMWNTVKELQLKASSAQWPKPYGLVAFELTNDGQADDVTLGRHRKGTYLELGASPRFDAGVAITLPVRLGLSAGNYYELNGVDHRFGFLSIGGMLGVPLRSVPGRFGTWDLHGGAELYVLGETTRAVNRDQRGNTSGRKIVLQGGIGLSY